jgi:hypothetical protein
MFQFYKVSSGVNLHQGEVMVVAWRKFGNILRKESFENIDCFDLHKILRKNSDPEYYEYNKEVTWL